MVVFEGESRKSLGRFKLLRYFSRQTCKQTNGMKAKEPENKPWLGSSAVQASFSAQKITKVAQNY